MKQLINKAKCREWILFIHSRFSFQVREQRMYFYPMEVIMEKKNKAVNLNQTKHFF